MAKRDKRIVVNEMYFKLIERKAQLLDYMAQADDGGLNVDLSVLKDLAKINKDWDKCDAHEFEGDTESYVEPKEPKD